MSQNSAPSSSCCPLILMSHGHMHFLYCIALFPLSCDRNWRSSPDSVILHKSHYHVFLFSSLVYKPAATTAISCWQFIVWADIFGAVTSSCQWGFSPLTTSGFVLPLSSISSLCFHTLQGNKRLVEWTVCPCSLVLTFIGDASESICQLCL